MEEFQTHLRPEPDSRNFSHPYAWETGVAQFDPNYLCGADILVQSIRQRVEKIVLIDHIRTHRLGLGAPHGDHQVV